MEKKKLKIQELKVQSFITELDPEIAQTAKGGEGEGTISKLSKTSAWTVSIYASIEISKEVTKAKSWFPYEDSTECTKITTTTGTTTAA